MDSDRIFFVTTVTAQRHPIFWRETTADLLIEILAHYRDERNFYSRIRHHARSRPCAADARGGDFFGAGYAVHQRRIFVSLEVPPARIAGEFYESSRARFCGLRGSSGVPPDESCAGAVGGAGGTVSVFVGPRRDAARRSATGAKALSLGEPPIAAL